MVIVVLIAVYLTGLIFCSLIAQSEGVEWDNIFLYISLIFWPVSLFAMWWTELILENT